ncbi:NF-kappa-B inhibitor cactus isoform X2 [Hyalella azteca]|uniref:NF-kappa-B inhibitor cactus isoform X2 n=1 Tax=Hyalella azteca TaxID=294128 RepID=A0A8B7PCF0_HYAAZ|nr:NF-kappa-B inhibitor cactus isoform X2 [Hyalella azteca]
MWQTGGVTRPEGHSKRSNDEGGSLSPGGDNYKSVYDSHSDSGFLSGSNLVSSSSVEDYNLSTNNQPSQTLLSRTLSGSSNDASHGGHHLDSQLSSSAITSSGCLDSGIDISDQMNSLQLRSSTQNYEDSVENNTSDDPSNSRISEDSHSRRDAGCNLEISRSHVTLLREVFSPDKDGDTQLHVAVMRGFIEVVYHITRLLPHQAFLDLANNSGRTALHLAVSAGVPAIARHLIVCGASPVARDLRGNTPLHVACGRKDAAMVTHLTRPVTVTEVMNAHLSYAPTHTPGLVAADLTNYQGETCVHVAAMAGDKEILQHLTWYGADVNAKECRSGRTALHLAVEARDPELVAHIVTACRASVTIETYARLSPYQLALANGATGIATQLLDLGAPAQLLPAAYTLDDDDDEDYDDQYSYTQETESGSTMNGWRDVDDIRLAGVSVHHSSLSANQALGPPVSTAPQTINADLYF